MRGISVSDDRKLYVQAVIDGQLPESYITDGEINFVYRKLWEQMIEPLLPHYSRDLNYN
jgi:hypothetical protein